MTFRTRQIRKNPRRRPLKIIKRSCFWLGGALKKVAPKQVRNVWGIIMVGIATLVVIRVTFAVYAFVSDFSAKRVIIETLGSEMQKDENGYTNIVLLGDGGHVRDGADLIDTIMVASIDYEKNAVTLLSIPRDYYVNSGLVQWKGKINELYRNHKFQFEEEDDRFGLFREVAGEITGLDIPYYMRVDFNGFVEVIDSLGGITVDVQNDIYDPYYPNETDNGYTVFQIEKGLQEMDGETALKFVRSRKTTSDFDRAARQQLVLKAVQEKALSKEILTDAGAIKDIYGAVNRNMNTNLSIRELIALAGFADQFDRSHLVTKVIHDDPGQEGGFLYTPERQYYNGQFVLVPFGDSLELIHKYCDLIFHQREIFFDMPRIEVLNATKYSGIARNAAYQLNRFGFNIVNIDNYFNANGEKKYLPKSAIFYYDWEEDKDKNILPKYQTTLNALEGFVKASPLPDDRMNATPGIDLSIVLGEDYDVFLVK